jgi:hypothetical protein
VVLVCWAPRSARPGPCLIVMASSTSTAECWPRIKSGGDSRPVEGVVGIVDGLGECIRRDAHVGSQRWEMRRLLDWETVALAGVFGGRLGCRAGRGET